MRDRDRDPIANRCFSFVFGPADWLAGQGVTNEPNVSSDIIQKLVPISPRDIKRLIVRSRLSSTSPTISPGTPSACPLSYKCKRKYIRTVACSDRQSTNTAAHFFEVVSPTRFIRFRCVRARKVRLNVYFAPRAGTSVYRLPGVSSLSMHR